VQGAREAARHRAAPRHRAARNTPAPLQARFFRITSTIRCCGDRGARRDVWNRSDRASHAQQAATAAGHLALTRGKRAYHEQGAYLGSCERPGVGPGAGPGPPRRRWMGLARGRGCRSPRRWMGLARGRGCRSPRRWMGLARGRGCRSPRRWMGLARGRGCRSPRPNDEDGSIGGREDMGPRRICSPLADVVAARVPAGPCPDFDSVALFVGGDHCDVAAVGGGAGAAPDAVPATDGAGLILRPCHVRLSRLRSRGTAPRHGIATQRGAPPPRPRPQR
jgi:hypothetical protein